MQRHGGQYGEKPVVVGMEHVHLGGGEACRAGHGDAAHPG